MGMADRIKKDIQDEILALLDETIDNELNGSDWNGLTVATIAREVLLDYKNRRKI